MHILKILGIFLFLITGSEAIAFTSWTCETDVVLQETSAEVNTDETQRFSDSTIIFFTNSPAAKVFSFDYFDFYFSSLHETRLSEKYINFSKYIVPSLDLTDIIFPFHSFS